jgi:SAM-dependent methyltransferase
MTDAQGLDLQIDYWNNVGPTKPLAHPVNLEQLGRYVQPSSRILDYGCGYGRALGTLQANAYTNLTGIDPARGMIAAARKNCPSIRFDVAEDYRRVNFPDASFDAVLLFAVLTSVPTDEGQRAIFSEIERLLSPNGILYISDMWLQKDARNIDRYVEGEKKYGIYGMFDLSDGATVRHHDPAWIETLTDGFETLHLEEIPVSTMNGNPATAFQWFGRKRGGTGQE